MTEQSEKAKYLRSLVCDFAFETRLCAEGVTLISGSDEVGRGSLLGVVCAASVILPHPEEFFIEGIRDSKLLSQKQRERLDGEIRKVAISISIAEVDAKTIDQINIYEATKLALLKSVEGLNPQPEALLIDSVKLPLPIPQLAIPHGDALSISIAAASIVAKVHRDALMRELDHKYPNYGIAKHKGYGTAEHMKALAKFGPTPIHRMSFRPVRLAANGPCKNCDTSELREHELHI